jgi:hypothetical protein
MKVKSEPGNCPGYAPLLRKIESLKEQFVSYSVIPVIVSLNYIMK